ncbi:MAG: hypothetical protein M3Y59_15080 [Myxococcota bacterium]|nr:hypothetical protein [Myxococcota bacterium]
MLAALLLAPLGCRERSTPPPPRLVGTSGPVNGALAPEDQRGIGGSGADLLEPAAPSDSPQKDPRPSSPFPAEDPIRPITP